MIEKTSMIDEVKFTAFIFAIDQLRNDKLITRAQCNIFKNKLYALFNLKSDADFHDIFDPKYVNHFVNKYVDSKLTFHKEYYPTIPFFRQNGCGINYQSVAIPHIALTFVGSEDYIEHKVRVLLCANNISELPMTYYVKGTPVANIDVKNIKMMRMLISRLVGQKLYND